MSGANMSNTLRHDRSIPDLQAHRLDNIIVAGSEHGIDLIGITFLCRTTWAIFFLHTRDCGLKSSRYHPSIMINAVLVFNNSGQPRLTKFYTQLVRSLRLMPKHSADYVPRRTLKPNNPS